MAPLTLPGRRRLIPAGDPRRVAIGAAALLALVVVSVSLRLKSIDNGFWIDEAIAIGIASSPFADIPGVLRLDGSPPLYFLLLHWWLALEGTAEAATRVPSVVFAALTIPVALLAGRSLFGTRAGWVCAGMFALNPFLTAHAQETRMYALVPLLGLVATTAFVNGFVHRRRRWVALFAGALTLMLYTHYWSLFFTAGSVVALVVVARRHEDRRGLLRDAVMAYGAAALLFAPWVPTLVFQATHTGAPWSSAPPVPAIGTALGSLTGGWVATAVLLAAAVPGVVYLVRAGRRPERTAAAALIALALSTVLAAWLASQVAPAWTVRYHAVALAPLLLVAGLAASRAGRAGAVGLALVALLWASDGVKADGPTTERRVAGTVAPALRSGDLLVSTQPERLPLLAHYLPRGLRYATPLGPMSDPRIVDWRDALARMRRAPGSESLAPYLDHLKVGHSVLLVRPVIDDHRRWRSPWNATVRRRSTLWRRALLRDNRFVPVERTPRSVLPKERGVQAEVFVKVRGGRARGARPAGRAAGGREQAAQAIGSASQERRFRSAYGARRVRARR